jgi:hypothetical protein
LPEPLHNVPPRDHNPFSSSYSRSDGFADIEHPANMGISRFQEDLKLVHLAFIVHQVDETSRL